MDRYATMCDCSCADHVLSDDGSWCLHEDVVAVEAERDLWRWRSEEIVKRLDPGPKPVREKLMDYEEWSVALDRYADSKRLHAAALEIVAATKGDG